MYALVYINWADLELFFTVAEERSFSAAARRLGLTQPTVSRRIAALEARLERALFRRDSEGTHLTEEGANLQPAAAQMARFAQELGQAAAGFDNRPLGVVRCAAPPGTAYELLVPFARSLASRLPDIELHLISGVQHIDLSKGHAELAIRTKTPSQPDLEVLVHLQLDVGVFCSQEYATALTRKFGQCQRGYELSELDWICWAYPNEHLEPMPTLQKLVPGFRPRFAANDYNVQCRAVAQGLGAMILPRSRHPSLPYPPFVELDLGLQLPPADAYLVCAKTMRWVPRVRAVVQELVTLFREVDGLRLLVNP